ncbi:MAG: PilN domain-containing protein [Methylovulum sp.]|nr:PilN domain-containing protein [Methylovulum sp.]
MMNLNSTIDMDFKAFLRWWRRELSFLVPEKISQFVNDRHGFVIVSPEAGKLRLTYTDNGHSPDYLVTLDRNEAGLAHYQRMLEQDERLAKATVILRLTGTDALVKELMLPIAAKENLHQVVAYELDRYTPFKADQVYFAVKPVGGEPEPGLIKVMLILTTRELLDNLYEDVKSMGLSPLFADYEGAANSIDLQHNFYNLLPESLRQKTAKAPRLIHFGLIISIIILLCAVLVMPVWFESRTIQVLEEKVKTIEKDAKKIKALQSEIDAVINETQKLLDEKKSTPAMVVVLNALSKIIKDDTSLAYLQYADGHIQIQGESPAASTLIGVLEDSEIFTNARFVSPVTQDNVSKLERFQITADITKAGGLGGTTQTE